MRYIKALLIAALALAAFTSIAASANAVSLPTVLQLAGVKEGTLTASSKTAKTAFNGIRNLTGTGYKFVLTSNFEMTSLGPSTLDFENSELSGKKCKANGDTAGTVLVPGEWHTVLALGGGPKLFLIWFLVTPSLTVECEGTNIIVTGNELVNAEPFGVETTTFTARTGKCTTTTPEFTAYENDTGEMLNAGLKSEVGGLKSATCQEVEGTQNYTASGMGVEVMEP